MFKIGTGENNTIPGKVYLHVQSDKEMAGQWVYCKSKLYLRRYKDEPGLLRMICPETFNKIGIIKLPCGDALKDAAAAKFNRDFVILTDGDSLFTIMVQFKTVKRNIKPEMKSEYEDMKKSEEEKKNSNISPEAKRPPPGKKENKKQNKPTLSENVKICEFYLVEYDITKHEEESDKPMEISEQPLVMELFEGYSGYFSIKECLRALRMHGNDIENASRWLLDEGEAERGKTVVKDKRWLLLGQSIVQENQESEVIENSVLAPYLIMNGQWTMNKSQVTVHLNSNYCKIFSTKSEDIAVLDDNQNVNAIRSTKALRRKNSGESDEQNEDENPDNWDESKRQQNKAQAELAAEFFENPELKGTFICSMQCEPISYDRSAICYSPTTHRFYSLALDTSNIVSLLEFGGYQTQNLVSMPEKLQASYEKRFALPNSPIQLAENLLGFLKYAEGFRYTLQWKWNSWETLYNRMHEVLINKQHNPKDDIDEKKFSAKLAKLKQKADKYRELAQEKWKSNLKINENEGLFEGIPFSVQPKSISTNFTRPPTEYRGRMSRRDAIRPRMPVDNFNELRPDIFGGDSPRYYEPPRGRYPPRGGYRLPPGRGRLEPREEFSHGMYSPPELLPRQPPGGMFGVPPDQPIFNNNQPDLFNFDARRPNIRAIPPFLRPEGVFQESEDDDKTMSKSAGNSPKSPIKKRPKSTTEIKEILKEPAFCSAGSIIDLKRLINLAKLLEQNDTTLVLHVWDQILIWVLHCGLLQNVRTLESSEENIKELSNYLFEFIKGKHENLSHVNKTHVLSYVWRIIVNGWEFIARTAEVQSVLFQEATKNIYGNISQNSYYNILLNPNSTPLELFCCKFFKYHSSFYPDLPMHQVHTQIFQLSKTIEDSANPIDHSKKPKSKSTLKLEFVENCSDNMCDVLQKHSCEEFLPKLAMLILPASDVSENYSLQDSECIIDERIKLYSGINIPNDKSMTVKDLEMHKQKLLDNLRNEHNSRIENNWKIIQDIIFTDFSSEENMSLGWMVYSQLILKGMSALYSNDEPSIIFMNKVLSSIQKIIIRFKEITNSYQKITQRNSAWINKFIEHLFWISNYFRGLVFTNENLYINIMPVLLDTISKLTEMCQNIVHPSIIENESHIIGESIDYTQYKTFETSHPYGRRESSRRETFVFPGAIAVCCELDKKSRSENGNDSLSLTSNEDSNNVYNNLGTNYRFSGKCHISTAYILVGNTVHVDFQANSQIQKSDPTARWGFKVTLRPIYGHSGKLLNNSSEQQENSKIISVDGKLSEKSSKLLISALKYYIRVATRHIQKLIKGIDLIDHEIKYKKFFDLPLVKEGIKLTKKPNLLPKPKSKKTDSSNQEENNADSLGTFVPKPKDKRKKYKLDEQVVNPIILKAYKESKENKGWLIEFMKAVRSIEKTPNIYEDEKKRPSFEKILQEKWVHAERSIALALIYHMGYIISEDKVQIDNEGLKKIGQTINEALRWMLKRLAGVKEYYYLKLAFLEECNRCYQKFKEKLTEEEKEKNKTLPVQSVPALEKSDSSNPDMPSKKKRVSVSKTKSKKKKVKFQKGAKLPLKKEDSKQVEAQKIEIRISQLPTVKKLELKSKLHENVYDMFLQRYQGNNELLKSIAEILHITNLDIKDIPETQRKIFLILQESMKPIINIDAPETFPDELSQEIPKSKSPYEIVANSVIRRTEFLFELHTAERKGTILKKISEGKIETGNKQNIDEKDDPFAELNLVKTPSMQPFLQGAQTPVTIKKAVDDYLKWKHSKTKVEDQQISDNIAKSIIFTITEGYSPLKLRKSLKTQERRALLRELGLKYLLDLVKEHGKSSLGKIIVGTATSSLHEGPFSFIEGCGPAATRPIIEHSMNLCAETIKQISTELENFENLENTIKKIGRDKIIHAKIVGNELKAILYLLSDLIVLLQGSSKNSILATICDSVNKNSLNTMISKILNVMFASQKYLNEVGYEFGLANLNSHLVEACKSVFGKIVEFVSEKGAKETQKEILIVILQMIEKEFKDTEKTENLLKMLHETLILFDIKTIDLEIITKCSNILLTILKNENTPCILKAASKCAQQVFKVLPAGSIVNETLLKIGKLSMIHNGTINDTNKIPTNREYYLILHLNSIEDNPSFILTALYHLENKQVAFSENYPKTIEEETKKGKEKFKGPFDNTNLFMHSNEEKVPQNPPKLNALSALINISRQFEEIIKLTQEEIKAEDTDEEKQRKLREKNFNRRISQHFSDAKVLCTQLLAKSYVEFPFALSYEKCLEIADLFQKAYAGLLDPVPINPHMKAENKEKKLGTGNSVVQSYPFAPRQQKNAPNTGFKAAPPIIIAKNQLTISLCEKEMFENIENYLNALINYQDKMRYLQGVKYAPTKSFGPNSIIIGSAYSICIEELISLLRQLTINPESDPSWISILSSKIQESLKILSSQKWKDIPNESKEILFGTLILVSGWLKCIRPGSQVEAIVNNIKETCTVIGGGYGSGGNIVYGVVKGDNSMTIHNIPIDLVKPLNDERWTKILGNVIDEENLMKSLININAEIIENSTKESCGKLCELVRLFLLKIAVEIQWKGKNSIETTEKLMNILSELSNKNTSEIIKRANESKLAESWERIIEKSDLSAMFFYVPHILKITNEVKDKLEIGKLGGLKTVFDYVQPMSSYLKSLPKKKADSHSETESAIKLLNYWEKHIIPHIQEMVKNAYKPWENYYYFEQLRDRLRNMDIDKAMEDALTICDQHLPANCVLPKDNRDWSAFVGEECIPGTWAIAKIDIGKDCANPVISKFASRKTVELPVLIKTADWRVQAALCEYLDPDTTQKVYLMIPIDSLREQDKPLPLPAPQMLNSDLISEFERDLQELTANCALRTFVSIYGSGKYTLSTKKVSDIVHWIVMDELKDNSIEGWIKNTKPILEYSADRAKTKSDLSLISRALKSVNYQSIRLDITGNLLQLTEQIKKLAQLPDLSEILNLHKWCIEAWKKLSEQINDCTVAIDLAQAADAYGRMNPNLYKGKDGNSIFPLHEVLKPGSDNGACIITFENSAFLSPNSKLKFFSDPQGHNLISQISAGKKPIAGIPPVILNHGKVWCHLHQGTIANLSAEDQDKAIPSTLPCCATFIPTIWTTACWLVETLTTELLNKPEQKLIESLYKPIVAIICEFVKKSTAPSILRQLSFVLLNRILRKMRYLYTLVPYQPGISLEKLGIDKEWIKQLADEINKLRNNEDSGEDTTYSEFIQNGAELIANALLPFSIDSQFDKNGVLKNENENLHVKLMEELKLPEWVQAIINVAIFLNYFRKEGQLTSEITHEILESIKLRNYQENVVLVKKLPSKFSYAQIKDEILQVIRNGKLRIVNPETDIIIPKDPKDENKHIGMALIISDGFDIVYSSISDNKEEQSGPEPAEAPEAKSEEKKEEEEEKGEPEESESAPPPNWFCPTCTLENPGSLANCDACGAARPELPPEPVAVPEMPKEPVISNPGIKTENYETIMWDKFIEMVSNIGIPKPEPKPEIKKEEKKEEKKEAKKEAKKDAKKNESKKEESKKEEAKKEEAKKEEAKKEPEKIKSEIEILRGKPVFEIDAYPIVDEAFKARLIGNDGFLPQVNATLRKLFEKMALLGREPGHTPLVRKDCSTFAAIGITKTKFTSANPNTFIKDLLLIAKEYPLMIWDLLAYHGYDIWLTKGGYFGKQDEIPQIWSISQLESLLEMCEVEICKETKMVLNLQPNNLRLTPFEFDPKPMINGPDENRLRMKYHPILSMQLDEIRLNWSILKKFNDYLAKAIPYINWTICVNMIPENSIPLTISSFLSASRKLCLSCVRRKLQEAVLIKTAIDRESAPKLTFERLKFNKESKNKDTNKKHSNTLIDSMFYKAYQQMKNIDLSQLRPQKKEGSDPFVSFAINFQGELVQGVAGPYRQFFTDISSELQPPIPATSGAFDFSHNPVKILWPTPNTASKHGEAKDKFTLSPNAKSTADLLMFEFLGVLMGCCIRTGVKLSLNLPSVIWKQIVREPLSLEDLEEVDASVVGVLKYLTQSGLTADQFESEFMESFTAMLSDMSSIDLIENGSNIQVTYDRREEYGELLLKERLRESAIQCKAVRKGISMVVPQAMLNLLTHQEISSLVCGKPTVDLEMLKRHTRYGKGLNENSDRVKFLWETLAELSESDKLRFIKFCWGQERLPANDEEYEQRQVRFMIKPVMKAMKGPEENALPKADTCFFNIELPAYKTKEKLKEKLMIAIYTDISSMNADDNPALQPGLSNGGEGGEEE